PRQGASKLCSMHRSRKERHGDPLIERGRGTPNNRHGWKGDAVSYGAVHYRLRTYRGKASAYLCACGCGEQAQDWAFDEPTGFSTDLSRYSPMTRACHKLMDNRSI